MLKHTPIPACGEGAGRGQLWVPEGGGGVASVVSPPGGGARRVQGGDGGIQENRGMVIGNGTMHEGLEGGKDHAGFPI